MDQKETSKYGHLAPCYGSACNETLENDLEIDDDAHIKVLENKIAQGMLIVHYLGPNSLKYKYLKSMFHFCIHL